MDRSFRTNKLYLAPKPTYGGQSGDTYGKDLKEKVEEMIEGYQKSTWIDMQDQYSYEMFNEVARRMKRMAPRDTGTLKNSITANAYTETEEGVQNYREITIRRTPYPSQKAGVLRHAGEVAKFQEYGYRYHEVWTGYLHKNSNYSGCGKTSLAVNKFTPFIDVAIEYSFGSNGKKLFDDVEKRLDRNMDYFLREPTRLYLPYSVQLDMDTLGEGTDKFLQRLKARGPIDQAIWRKFKAHSEHGKVKVDLFKEAANVALKSRRGFAKYVTNMSPGEMKNFIRDSIHRKLAIGQAKIDNNNKWNIIKQRRADAKKRAGFKMGLSSLVKR